MKEEKANEIFERVKKEWIKRHGEKNLNPAILNTLKKSLLSIPDDDGNKRVKSLSTGKTHLVPIERIILNGLRGDELDKYPVEKEN